MKNKGFTLIELLAVIVILAIIALIAVPIILNIIDSTKKSANERSKELYLDAVEQAIARKNLTEKNGYNPDSCTANGTDKLDCEKDGEPLDPLTVEVNGAKPTRGTIKFENGKIASSTLEFGTSQSETTKTIGRAVTESNKTLVGTIPQGNFAKGDEYIINVDGTNEYHFYVLSTDGDKVNLIMSENIGTFVDWYNDDGNDKGPVTAITALHNATKNWSNIPNVQMNYTNEGNGNSYCENPDTVEQELCTVGYQGIKTIGNITKIIANDGTETASYENLKARLPMKSEIEGTGCTETSESCPAWMVNKLEIIGGKYENIIEITSDFGYWSLSSFSDSCVCYVGQSANLTCYHGIFSEGDGIRPVITITKSSLN